MIDLCMLCAWQLVYVGGYEGGMVWRAALPGFSYDETQTLKSKQCGLLVHACVLFKSSPSRFPLSTLLVC